MNILTKSINRLLIARQIPIFSKLSWLELRAIARKCKLVEYKKGDVIYRNGSPADAFYCLISGRLQGYLSKINGEKINTEIIARGMYFGVDSLLVGENHSYTVEAINDSVILRIEKSDFEGILKAVPHLGIELSHSLSRRIKRGFSGPRISPDENIIISIYSPVKGSGSSTYAINLALSLEKETAKKVIFVSINSKSQGFASGPSSSVSEASPHWKKTGIDLAGIIGDHEKISKNILHDKLKVDVLNVVFDPKNDWLVSQMSHFVSLLTNDYHFVVVDLPNEMDDVVFKTLTQSDLVHLICMDRQEDLELTKHVLGRLKSYLKEGFNRQKIQVMLSGLDPKEYLSYEEVNKTINYNVQRTLPNIRPEELKGAVVSDVLTLILPDAQSGYAKAIRRIARQIGGVLVGLVLGGGAALGIAHVGVLRVLEQENIPIDIVVGSSIGALIGGLWASGKNADEIEIIAREFQTKASMQKLLDFTIPKSGLIIGSSIVRWLKKHLGEATFYNAKIPLKIIAYDLLKREELVIEEGSIVDAIRQSIAIPGVIQPILKKGRLIIDGGVVNPLPTNAIANMGIKKIIAVNVLQSPDDIVQGYEVAEKQVREEEKIPFTKSPVRYLGVRIRRFFLRLVYPNIADIIVRSLQAVEYVIAEQSAQQADIVIHPDLVGVNWFELYQVDRLIKSGEEAAVKQLSDIKKLVHR